MQHKMFVMHDSKVSADFVQGAEEALVEFFGFYRRAKALDVEINNLGHWRHEDYLQSENTLRQWYSYDWYWQYTRNKSDRKDQLDADLMLKLLFSEPWRQSIRHVDVVIVDEDIYAPECRFVIGLAAEMVGAIISTHRFKTIRNEQLRVETFKTAVMHEVGHVYGLPQKYRPSTEESLGLHCTETCIMRQGLVVPHDWENMTRDRLKHGPFCRHCQKDLARIT